MAVKRFHLAEQDNPRFCLNELFPAAEDLRHPRCRELRKRYGLEKIVRGEKDELTRILLLRNWLQQHIKVSNPRPTRVPADAFAILDAARRGGRFHCAHFSRVQHAVLNAFGYVTRTLGAGYGGRGKGEGGHHGVNEVWVNALSKWMLIDAKYDLHFEKDGVPLSALEMRDEILKDGAKTVQRVKRPNRRPSHVKFKERPRTYRWVSWHFATNGFTQYPAAESSMLVLYIDDYARKHTWYRDGHPHWAYKAKYFVECERRSVIEWTPNVTASSVRLTTEKAYIRLRSCTPNFKTYEMKRGEGAWRRCSQALELAIPKHGLCLAFRTVNLMDVRGPEHRVRIEPTGAQQP